MDFRETKWKIELIQDLLNEITEECNKELKKIKKYYKENGNNK